tara:strand:- start:545 stop:847 length:303 start_codon:yes stop_codon:yes gene_type:complete
MALKISGTTVVDNSRNIENVQNLSASGVSTIANLQITTGIVTSSTGIVTYYGDGSKLTGIEAGGGVLTVGRRVGTAATINVSAGSTTILLRTGVTTTLNV